VTRTLLVNGVLIDPERAAPEPGALLLEAGRIAARLAPAASPPDGCAVVDLGGAGVAPGFVDVHYHGSHVFAPASDPEALRAALRHDAVSRLCEGVTAFLATSIALEAASLRAFVTALSGHVRESGAECDAGRDASAAGMGAAPAAGTDAAPAAGAGPAPAAPAARVLGLHLEGPWIRAEAAGAQPVPALRAPERDEVAEVLDRAAGCVRMVTLAPELPGAGALVETLAARGIVPALGHSLADAACVDEAVARGARHVTHLFNAMGPLHHRQPGLAACALGDERLSFDLICDGLHVHPTVVRLALRAASERYLLATDQVRLPQDGARRTPDREPAKVARAQASPAHEGRSGAPPDAAFGARPDAAFGAAALVDAADTWRLSDGRLAASRLALDQGVRNAVHFGGRPLVEAVAAATLRPARLLGLEARHGTLRPGAHADLVVLDAAGGLRETWLAGRLVHAVA